MGSFFEVGVVAESKKTGDYLLNLAITTIQKEEEILSEFIPASVTSRVNANAYREPVIVPQSFYDLLKRSIKISDLTRGVFDITTKPIKEIYDFKKRKIAIPPSNKIDEVLKGVGYHKIKLDDDALSIKFKNSKTQISFAGIGKGYVADLVKNIWLNNGVTAGFINASGDLTAFGKSLDGDSWYVSIVDPETKKKLFHVPIDNFSVATSGNYEQYFVCQNTRYAHILHPQTGYPIEEDLTSVSVFSPSAELSDALATAVYVMGKENGIKFVNQLPNTFCILIDKSKNFYFSKNIKYENI